MLPRSPLMIEHRLIEKAIDIMSTALEHFKKDDKTIKQKKRFEIPNLFFC